MNHDWGVSVSEGLPTETIIEIRDGLKSGEIRLEFADFVEITPEVAKWQEEVTEQMIAAYDAELHRRLS